MPSPDWQRGLVLESMELMIARTYSFAIAVLLLLVGNSAAFAQLLDEVDFRREGNNAIVRIHFGAPIQFQPPAKEPSVIWGPKSVQQLQFLVTMPK